MPGAAKRKKTEQEAAEQQPKSEESSTSRRRAHGAGAARSTWKRHLAAFVLLLGPFSSLLLFFLLVTGFLDALALLPHFAGGLSFGHGGKASCVVRHVFHGRMAGHAASLRFLMRDPVDGNESDEAIAADAVREGVDVEDFKVLLSELADPQEGRSTSCRLAGWASVRWSQARHEARMSGSAYVHATQDARDAWNYKTVDSLSLDHLASLMRERMDASASEDEICRAVTASSLKSSEEWGKSVEELCKGTYGYARETLSHYLKIAFGVVFVRVLLSLREVVQDWSVAPPANDKKKSN